VNGASALVDMSVVCQNGIASTLSVCRNLHTSEKLSSINILKHSQNGRELANAVGKCNKLYCKLVSNCGTVSFLYFLVLYVCFNYNKTIITH